MDFSYKIRQQAEICIIDFKGCTLDKSQSKDLLSDIEGLLREGHYKMIVNLKDIDYMNSSGLNVLINILTKCRNHNGDLIICNIPEKVKKLLVISKLTSVFEMVRSEEEAISKLK